MVVCDGARWLGCRTSLASSSARSPRAVNPRAIKAMPRSIGRPDLRAPCRSPRCYPSTIRKWSRLNSQIPIRVGCRSEDAIGDRNAGVPPVGNDELAAKRRARVRGDEDRTPVCPARASCEVMLEHEQVVQVVGGHEGGRTHVDQPTLDVLQCGVDSQLAGVRDHLVTAESAGDDGPQQSGVWLDGKRDRHGRRRLRRTGWAIREDASPARRAPFRIPEPCRAVTRRSLRGTGGLASGHRRLNSVSST